MSVTMEERLKRRKLDALKRGVHRLSGGEALPLGVHMVGIGKAGIGVVSEVLRSLQPDAPKFVALAIDIGGQDLATLRDLTASISPERAEIMTVAIDVPSQADLFSALENYREYLQLEYPRYNWNPNFEPWLPPETQISPAGRSYQRAVAKAIYGQAYYSGNRPVERALKAFAAAVDAANAQTMVAIVFGLGGGTGSGIAVDLARHLSNGIFGRRVLIAGVGIAPCDGDALEHDGAGLFTVLNELDCLNDEEKNRGVVQSCGELFRNPFTAGFIMVPQQQIWLATKNLAATQHRVNQELASLMTLRHGANMWELLRLLNWVAAPSTQHSAARTPWGPKWVHLLGFTDDSDGAIDTQLPGELGLLPSYMPEFIELRVADTEMSTAAGLAHGLDLAFGPDVPPVVVSGAAPGSAQFILPCVSKHDLVMFERAQAYYQAAPYDARLLDHAMLLEQGIMLCEPSSRLEGMAGAGLWGGPSWIAVPLADLYASDPGLSSMQSQSA